MHRARILGRNFGLFIPMVLVAFFIAVSQGYVPGLNLVNLSVFFVSIFLYIPSFLQNDRTSALTDLRKEGISDYFVFSRKLLGNRIGSNETWASPSDQKTHNYRISFNDMEHGQKNGEEVLKTMKSTARIIWIRPITWFVFTVACFVLNFVSFKTIIPVLNVMTVGNPVAYYFREFVFYLPCALAAACPILSFIFVIIRDKILYKCAFELATEIEKEASDKVEPGKTWYHNICPNCGTKSTDSVKNCVNCGTSLVIREGGGNLNSIRFM